MAYKYSDSLSLNINNIQAYYCDYQKQLQPIIAELKVKVESNAPFYKVLHSPSSLWITSYIRVAQQIQNNFDTVLIIGMGGATLNAQAVISCVTPIKPVKPNIYFVNNTDPLYLAAILHKINLKSTACIIISKSGETFETITLTNALLDQYKNTNVVNFNKHLYFIIGQENNKLHRLAKEIEANTYLHPNDINGRYASFTNVTTLPGLIAGIDMESFFAGAEQVLSEFWSDDINNISAKSAIVTMASGKSILVNIGYLQCFNSFLEWYSQIISESLGKDGHGFTPLRGLGPNDQHSMLQLYLDGPQDKLFTFFQVQQNITTRSDFVSLSQANAVCFDATVQALQQKSLPVKIITLSNLSAKSVGALMMHCIIEVVILGHLLKINPFNQPAVEAIKTNIKLLLANNNQL